MNQYRAVVSMGDGQSKRHVATANTHEQKSRRAKRASRKAVLRENHQARSQAKARPTQAARSSAAEPTAEEDYGLDEEVMDIIRWAVNPPEKPIHTPAPQHASDTVQNQTKTQPSQTEPAAEEDYGLDEEVMDTIRWAVNPPEKPIHTAVPQPTPDAVPTQGTTRPSQPTLFSAAELPAEEEYDSEEEMEMTRRALNYPPTKPTRIFSPPPLDLVAPRTSEPWRIFPCRRPVCAVCRSSQTTCSIHSRESAIFTSQPTRPARTQEMDGGVYELLESRAAEESVQDYHRPDDEEVFAEIERDPDYYTKAEREVTRRLGCAWRGDPEAEIMDYSTTGNGWQAWRAGVIY
ncbi:hypothetical protein B0T22DRAFT_483367 [Podospora appendiculata]|uniref:Uncharacterized protein n=1 Tax=Podospora appendiculata TaxID=314037 RepID=A0AAE0X2E0_9PEZI|nr:hypothetical protein B0T22DRAFT_483367 [Podospora appendiculata]